MEKMFRSAVISQDKLYRYRLYRVWNAHLPLLMWLGLNPSKADGETDDNTVRRMIGFSRAWGYGGFRLGNLYGYRSTDPRKLADWDDPIGPGNDQALINMSTACQKVVACWGSNSIIGSRGEDVVRLIFEHTEFETIHCLGTTANDSPRHPLRLAKTTELLPFRKRQRIKANS